MRWNDELGQNHCFCLEENFYATVKRISREQSRLYFINVSPLELHLLSRNSENKIESSCFCKNTTHINLRFPSIHTFLSEQ